MAEARSFCSSPSSFRRLRISRETSIQPSLTDGTSLIQVNEKPYSRTDGIDGQQYLTYNGECVVHSRPTARPEDAATRSVADTGRFELTRITVKFTAKELELLSSLAADQLFRREFIDSRLP